MVFRRSGVIMLQDRSRTWASPHSSQTRLLIVERRLLHLLPLGVSVPGTDAQDVIHQEDPVNISASLAMNIPTIASLAQCVGLESLALRRHMDSKLATLPCSAK